MKRRYGVKYRLLTAVIVLCLIGISGCTQLQEEIGDAEINDNPETGNKTTAGDRKVTAGRTEAAEPEDNTIVIENYGVEVTFGPEWEEEEDSPFDLQCYNQNAYVSIFCYEKIDLADNQEPIDIFDYQIEDIFSRRNNVELIVEGTKREADGKNIYSEIYTAERDGMKNAYYCSLVEFKESDEKFIWVMFSGMPSYILNNMEIWDQILDSIQVRNGMV